MLLCSGTTKLSLCGLTLPQAQARGQARGPPRGRACDTTVGGARYGVGHAQVNDCRDVRVLRVWLAHHQVGGPLR